jgi:hypothetical protein
MGHSKALLNITLNDLCGVQSCCGKNPVWSRHIVRRHGEEVMRNSESTQCRIIIPRTTTVIIPLVIILMKLA